MRRARRGFEHGVSFLASQRDFLRSVRPNGHEMVRRRVPLTPLARLVQWPVPRLRAGRRDRDVHGLFRHLSYPAGVRRSADPFFRGGPPQSAEANKALVCRRFKELDTRNFAFIDELIPEDYVDHNPPLPNLEPGRKGARPRRSPAIELPTLRRLPRCSAHNRGSNGGR
jgi:hypothetical protein